MQVLLVCGISGISATKLLASRWTRWSCRSFLSKHDVSDEFCMWLHSSPCSVLVCIAAAPRRWCGGNWLRKGSWSTQHTHRRLQIPWAGLASDRQRHPAGSSPALVGIRLSRHMLLASLQTLVALYSRCHETQAVKGKVQTTSIWIEMQTFPSWTGSRWVRKRGAGQWPGWWCPKPLLPLGRETKWLTGFACGPSVLERRRRRWAGRSWCTVRLWSAEDPSYSLIPSCSSLAQYPIPLAAPLHLVLACRQKRGAEGAWGWEEQQSGRVRSSPVVCHKQWWQGKFALQRCLVCPGSTTFLEKPTWILLSTFWMKAAMDSHSDGQGGSSLHCELNLICGDPSGGPRASKAGMDVQQRGPEVQSPSLTVPVLWWLCLSGLRRPALWPWDSQPSWSLSVTGDLISNTGPQLQLCWQWVVRLAYTMLLGSIFSSERSELLGLAREGWRKLLPPRTMALGTDATVKSWKCCPWALH